MIFIRAVKCCRNFAPVLNFAKGWKDIVLQLVDIVVSQFKDMHVVS